MKRVQFDDKWTPVYFVLPQILIIAVFFLWPAFEAIRLSFLLEDPWGMSSEFVWFENYQDVFADPEYVETIVVTTLFSAAVTAISLFFGMLLAVKVDGMLHGGAGYKPLIVWAYAIAPAVGGLVARFLFSPAIDIGFSASIGNAITLKLQKQDEKRRKGFIINELHD